jgi:hypothetical protein
MAIKITKPLVTQEGFEVNECFGFLSIYLLDSSWVNIAYYKSEADFEAGKQSLNIQELPSRCGLTLSAQQFWGNALASDITNQCIAQIEAVIGAGTCTIITLEP